MLPSEISTQVIKRKAAAHPGIKGFRLEPTGIPGCPPILAFRIDELTPELAEALYEVYQQCRQEVALSGYRAGTLPAMPLLS
jgi:hypothetical protein